MTRISRMLSKTLRHDPGRLGITLDESGWVEVDTLLAAFARKGMTIDRATLDHVVATNNKQRFILVDGWIRANQGHSIPVDLGLDPVEPPELLFHGTGESSVPAILAEGLRRGGRHHVHLSADTATARQVGGRRGRPVVLTVLAGQLAATGVVFYRSANGVWLVDAVPPEYLREP